MSAVLIEICTMPIPTYARNFVLAGAAFVTYALLSAMLILQMLIGVLCDVCSRVGS